MRSPLLLVSLACLAQAAAGCADHIGDSCALASDCSQRGDRVCDLASPDGYCTIFGCDHDTCPGEAVCVRFFSIGSTNRPCNPRLEDRGEDRCSADEICTLAGHCVPRTAEMRFCMRKCDDSGDCRDKYECRNEELMKQNGGEPVPRPGEPIGENLQGFCAARRL